MRYNIEFAHIYADQKFGKEQEESIEALKKFLMEGKEEFVAGILIDDFSPKKGSLNIEEYGDEIASYRVPLDFVVLESQLQSESLRLLNLVKKKKKQMFNNKQDFVLVLPRETIGLTKNNKPTCSLLIATWILARLGKINLPREAFFKNPKNFSSERLVTFLPKKYLESERKAHEIIKAAGYERELDVVDYFWF